MQIILLEEFIESMFAKPEAFAGETSHSVTIYGVVEFALRCHNHHLARGACEVGAVGIGTIFRYVLNAVPLHTIRESHQLVPLCVELVDKPTAT